MSEFAGETAPITGAANCGVAALPRCPRSTGLYCSGTPDDIAAGALALLSPKHSANNAGKVLAIDGGIALHNWITLPKSL